jgi:methyl-accepting chemotaxis protein
MLYNPRLKQAFDAIDRSYAIIEFKTDGTILNANQNFLNAMGYTLDEIKGRHHRMFVNEEYANSEEYKEFWNRLKNGEYFVAEYQRFAKHGREVWIQASYNPIFNIFGKPSRVIKLATDITESKQKNSYYLGQIQAINKAQAVIEFEVDGTIVNANQNFLNAVVYTLDEIKGKHHRMFVSEQYAKSAEYGNFWTRLKNGEYFCAEYQRFGKMVKKFGSALVITR